MTFEQVEPNLWYLLCYVSYAVAAAGRSILSSVSFGSLRLTGKTKEKQTPKISINNSFCLVEFFQPPSTLYP